MLERLKRGEILPDGRSVLQEKALIHQSPGAAVWVTIRITDAAPLTLSMELQHYRGVRWIRWFGRRKVHLFTILGLLDRN